MKIFCHLRNKYTNYLKPVQHRILYYRCLWWARM